MVGGWKGGKERRREQRRQQRGRERGRERGRGVKKVIEGRPQVGLNIHSAAQASLASVPTETYPSTLSPFLARVFHASSYSHSQSHSPPLFQVDTTILLRQSNLPLCPLLPPSAQPGFVRRFCGCASRMAHCSLAPPLPLRQPHCLKRCWCEYIRCCCFCYCFCLYSSEERWLYRSWSSHGTVHQPPAHTCSAFSTVTECRYCPNHCECDWSHQGGK